MSTQVFFLLGLLATIVAADIRPVGSYALPASSHSDEYESPKYSFEWSIEDDSSENYFGHKENRDDDYTQGSYYIRLPDSRLQKVVYYVNGGSGYIADVTYEGEAHYSEEFNQDDDHYLPPPSTFYSR